MRLVGLSTGVPKTDERSLEESGSAALVNPGAEGFIWSSEETGRTSRGSVAEGEGQQQKRAVHCVEASQRPQQMKGHSLARESELIRRSALSLLIAAYSHSITCPNTKSCDSAKGDITKCSGSCGSLFHLACIKDDVANKKTRSGRDWKCKKCRSSSLQSDDSCASEETTKDFLFKLMQNFKSELFGELKPYRAEMAELSAAVNLSRIN
ncbi:hypothetical protein J6590_065943 [Homalodisca vitripennis]|nr:hypothetical protein J6590_065943 [Homalodisca vitripennis]